MNNGASQAFFIVLVLLVASAAGYLTLSLPEANVSDSQYPSVTTAPVGLSIQIQTNSTALHVGGSLHATVGLVNNLSGGLSLPIGTSPASQVLDEWARNSSGCGLRFAEVFNTFGFAIFNGTYDSSNSSQAGSPLLMAPPVGGLKCPFVAPYPNSIKGIYLEPNSQMASIYYYDSYYSKDMQLNITTGQCVTASWKSSGGYEYFNGTTSTFGPSTHLSYSCPDGASLDGYWARPPGGYYAIDDRDNSSVLAGLKGLYQDYFRPFPVGDYTIVAKDVWNQTVFAYFRVLP